MTKVENGKFGVVKPADKNEKVEKSSAPPKAKPTTPTVGKDNQLQSELQQAGLVQPKKKKGAKPIDKAAQPEVKKQDVNAPLTQRLAGYEAEVKKRHPDMPSEVLSKIKSCKSAGEAKRLVKEYLQKTSLT